MVLRRQEADARHIKDPYKIRTATLRIYSLTVGTMIVGGGGGGRRAGDTLMASWKTVEGILYVCLSHTVSEYSQFQLWLCGNNTWCYPVINVSQIPSDGRTIKKVYIYRDTFRPKRRGEQRATMSVYVVCPYLLD